jgi:hypothetical protein
MKTHYTFIKFEYAQQVEAWLCLNVKSNDALGGCTYYKPWHQWVFNATETAVFSAGCLKDIAHFLFQLNKEPRHD